MTAERLAVIGRGRRRHELRGRRWCCPTGGQHAVVLPLQGTSYLVGKDSPGAGRGPRSAPRRYTRQRLDREVARCARVISSGSVLELIQSPPTTGAAEKAGPRGHAGRKVFSASAPPQASHRPRPKRAGHGKRAPAPEPQSEQAQHGCLPDRGRGGGGPRNGAARHYRVVGRIWTAGRWREKVKSSIDDPAGPGSPKSR